MDINHRKELEGNVIGCLLQKNSLIPECAVELTKADFQVYGQVYAAILSVFKADGRVSVLSLPTDRQETREAVALFADGADPSSFPALLRRLQEDSTRERIVLACKDTLTALERPEGDLAEITATFLQAATAATNHGHHDEGSDMSDALKAYFEDRQKPHRRFPTGWGALDELLHGGWELGSYIICGGSTSTGKTAMMLNAALSAARAGRRVLYFSFEMPKTALAERALGITTGGNPRGLSKDDLRRASSDLRQLPLRLYCGLHRRTVDALSAICRREKLRHDDLSLVCVDYLQQLQAGPKNASRYEKLTEVSAGLQALAQELGLCFFVGSQLSRNPARENAKPCLSDLRDSGAIEQDADCVLLISRVAGSENLDLDLAKNRRGKTGELTLHFDLESQRITG